MSVLLLILGIVVAVSGLASIGFGIPLNEIALGATLMSGGATALIGGLILIGLSAVVSELARLSDGLSGAAPRALHRSGDSFDPAALSTAPFTPSNARPLPTLNAPFPPRSRGEAPAREARAAAPQQSSPTSVEVSAAAIERLRSTIPRTEASRIEPPPAAHREEAPLSPNGVAAPQHAPDRARVASQALPEPRVTGEERGGAAEALKASRLDFLFRSRPTRPAQPESFDTLRPAPSRTARDAAAAVERQPTSESAERPSEIAAPPAPDVHAETAQPQSSPAPAVLKSGVVDGMAYTLYTDGSIEAKLPEGTVRFASVAELRAHIESNS